MKLLLALITAALLLVAGCSGSNEQSTKKNINNSTNSSSIINFGQWVPYANNTGKSNVVSYRIGSDYIDVRFRSGNRTDYRYSYSSAGKEKVETMKRLAKNGQGLNGYINRNARKLYER